MSKKVAKKKKVKLIKTRLFTAIFSVMFIVSLFMGINALAETNPFSLTNATIEEKSATTTGSIQSFDNDKVNNDITFHKLNDYVTYKLVIKNNNNDITILSITDDNSNEYIAYEYDKHENEKVNKGSSINFIVKAVYKTELTDTSKRNQTNNVKFTITYLEDGEVKGDTIIINPKTGDGISKSFIMLIISSVGLITCIALDKKRKNKKLSKVSMFIITGLLITPIVVKAATFAYNLSLVTNYKLNDKIVVTIDDKVNTPTKQTIEYNTKLDSLPSPSKEGYTLTNWTVNNEEFDITKEITNDITIEANYRKNNYTITFNSNVPVGGTLDPATSMVDMDMKYDEEKNLLPNGYLVTGYLFDSWNTMPDGSGTKYEDMDSVKNLTSTDGETVTLYARWGATPYTVIFDKNSTQATGTMENISKAYNETFNLPENTYERTGYSFAGWNTSPMGDGTHYDDKQSVKNLDIDGEVTLYAEWSPALITITFDINTDDPEATGTMAGQIVVYDVRNNINENKFTRTGYAFDSWNTEPDGSGTKYDDKADITNVFLDNTTLYAQWAVTPYIVIFNKNGGTGSMNNQEIAYGQQVALTKNTYERTGYTFTGWNIQVDGQGIHYDDEEEVKNLDIDGEVNLYAEWEANKYTITFDKNDSYATGTMNTQDVTFEATETLIANSFTNYQHTFKGWNTKADGTGTHYSNEDYITINNPNDFILYAEWKAQLEASSPGQDLTLLSTTKCTANESITLSTGTVCKRAINLHEETCVSGQCVSMGYTESGSKGTSTVTYGNCGVQGALNSGDAFTCDVDGDGNYDEKLERFYYVSDYFNTKTKSFEDDTAVLIYYRATTNGQGTTNGLSKSYNSLIIDGPDITNLPKNSLWKNISLKNTKRDILAFREGEDYTSAVEAGDLPIDFDYSGYSARLLTIPEAKVGCNVATISSTAGETDYCYYMYENSRFINNNASVAEAIGVPLENPYISHGATDNINLNLRWLIQSRSGPDGPRAFIKSWTNTRVSTRPAIEVPKSKISY